MLPIFIPKLVIMGAKKKHVHAIMTSDLVHNRNCYAYLLKLKPWITQSILDLNLAYLTPITRLTDQYSNQFAYGNLYSRAIGSLEAHIESLYPKLNPEQTKAMDELILSIYHNDNEILDHSDWINEISTQIRPTHSNASKLIEQELVDRTQRVNQLTPYQIDSIPSRIQSLFSANFKPQLDTNIPSLKNYSYRKNIGPTEYRFSTQAQRHNGVVRVSPLFKQWLAIKAKQIPSTQSVSHIYFNNLSLDKDSLDLPRSKERELSLALHELEKDSSLNIAVITLPASQSLMGADHYKMTTDRLSYASVFNELLRVAEGKPHESGVSDFHISPSTRTKLFGTHKNQTRILKQLLTNSLTTLGINSEDFLSTAEKQAVWLHFNKFELTNYIVTTLNPTGFNFSCKDAIDRGAVSSIYFNLLKSFQSEQPMQREEFERALDSAAANVKGRGMNFHRKIIWSTLDKYVNSHYEALLNDDNKSWLIFWRDMHCPHSIVNQLLKTRIIQLTKQLNALPAELINLHKAGNKLISAISDQYNQQISGQRLLLELVSRTSQLLCNPHSSADSLESYRNLAKELQINHPVLNIIGGLAEAFLGILLYLPSFGYSNQLIIHGIATYKSGFFADQRSKLSADIQDFSNLFQTSTAS
jgi:hypothetical protein